MARLPFAMLLLFYQSIALAILLPPEAIALAFTFSAGVGLVFGMFPAIKASRLDPIEALRHE